MRVRHLPSRILQQVGVGSLQHARRTTVKTGGMFAQTLAAPAGLDADELHPLFLEELMEDANRIRAAANAGDNRARQFAFDFEDLRARLAADAFMKIANHPRVRMSAQHAAEQIVSCTSVDHPIAHRLVDRVFQRTRTRLHAAYLSP